MMFWVLVAVIPALIATLLTYRFCNPESRMHLLDHPNERSLHSQPKPRTGGVAILVGFFLSIPAWLAIVVPTPSMVWIIIGAGIIAGLSFLDDRRNLSIGVRLLGHVLGASIVVIAAGLGLPVEVSIPWLAWLGPGLSIVFLVWMANLYNFMDGMDGFAGGMAVIGFGTFAVFGFLAGNLAFAIFSLTLASASFGFLLFNFPPARIFMGDTGSAALGMMAGGLILWGAREAVFPFWAGALVFSPFIVDATLTLLRRLLRRERFWLAHKTHYYQRLVLLGWGHRKTVLTEYALMLACAGSALWGASKPAMTQTGVLIFWGLAYIVLVATVHALERRVANGLS